MVFDLSGVCVRVILLFARGRQEAHHLHGQLQPLKVMLEVLSLHSEAVLRPQGGHRASPGESPQRRDDQVAQMRMS